MTSATTGIGASALPQQSSTGIDVERCSGTSLVVERFDQRFRREPRRLRWRVSKSAPIDARARLTARDQGGILAARDPEHL
jgi:hypothetical protein